jgi:hypothetical protein
MIQLKDAELCRLSVHRVGNKSEDDPILYSDQEINLNDPILKSILQKYFLSGFKDQNFFNLSHPSDVNLNEVFHFSTKIMENPSSITAISRDLAMHLYESSDHPNIKAGDFCVAWFENCTVDGEYANAIGLFKVENKDTFLKITENFSILHEEGINISKIDKGAIVLNIEKENGYLVSMIDNTNKSQEAKYWTEDFLKVKPREDSFYHTKNYMQLCKNFCTEVLDKKEQVEKPDQIDFLNRSSGFFSQKENFNVEEFENEVIADPEIIDKFRGFKSNFQETNDVQIFDEFDISSNAVKGNKKVFKSILKLDKNFHIYVHGNRNLIERGFDEDKQMSYYKVYFTNETS